MRPVASLLGIGYLRPAPGTWGSAAALVLALAIHVTGGPWLLLALLLVALLAGFAAARAVTTDPTVGSDPSWVVIDELCGQWIAILPVSFGAWHVGAPVTALWPGWIAAFLLFRLFDVWKPGVIGRMDRRGDFWGLMMDDILAGVAAAVGVVVLAGVAHGVMRA